jgi:hypothetical protein
MAAAKRRVQTTAIVPQNTVTSMAPSRFSALERIFAALLAVGGVVTLAADRLGNERAKTFGIIIVFIAAIVFGLNMIVERQAEIGTRYTSSVNPSFHVFRGIGAIAWGVVFVLAGLLIVGAGVLWMTGHPLQPFVEERSGPFTVLAGLLITALGIGSASPATYRHGDLEHPSSRRIDRMLAVIGIVPLGLAILAWGLVKTLVAG